MRQHQAAEPQHAVAERRFDLQIVGAPDHSSHGAQEEAEADGRHDNGELRIAEDWPHHEAFCQHPEQRHGTDGGYESKPVIKTKQADEGEGEEAAQHHQVTLCEVDDFGGLVNKNKAKRDQAIDTAERNTAHQLLNEVQHPGYPSPDVPRFCRSHLVTSRSYRSPRSVLVSTCYAFFARAF